MDIKRTGRLIAARRKQKNLTQQELADALGVGNRAVSKWETGQGMPDISLLEDLSRVLEISIDDLVRGTDITQISRQKEPEGGRETVLFQGGNEALPRYCRRLALLQQRALLPMRPAILTVLWGVLVLLCVVLTALAILFPARDLRPFALLLVVPAVALVFGYQGYRIYARVYQKNRCHPENPKGVYTYRFTDSGIEIAGGTGSRKIAYGSVASISYSQDTLLFRCGRTFYLMEAEDFRCGALPDCLAFLQKRCPSAKTLPLSEEKRFRPIVGCACLIAAFLPAGLQFAVHFLGPRYEIAYTKDYYGILVTAFTLLLLFIGGLLSTRRKKPWQATLSIWAALTLLAVGMVWTTPPVTSASIVTSSDNGSCTLVLKTDRETGKTKRFRTLFPMLSMYRETLPYTVEQPVKTQWLTNDICAVTYISPDDGEIHQYVATYGDRGNGISYHSMISVLSSASDWMVTDVVDSAGWQLKTEDGFLWVGDGAQQERFQLEDCVPFGTTALVLCQDGRPKWTLALGEDCRVDGGVLQEGSLVACRVSMEKTAPIVFYHTH